MRVVAFGVILLLLSFSEANGQSDSVKKIEAWCLHQAKQIKESFPYMSELEVLYYLKKGYGALRFDEDGELSSALYENWELQFKNGKVHSLNASINLKLDSINFFTNGLEIRFLTTDTIVKPEVKSDDCRILSSRRYSLVLLPLKIYDRGKLIALSNDGHTYNTVSGQHLDNATFVQILNTLKKNKRFELYYQDFESISVKW